MDLNLSAIRTGRLTDTRGLPSHHSAWLTRLSLLRPPSHLREWHAFDHLLSFAGHAIRFFESPTCVIRYREQCELHTVGSLVNTRLGDGRLKAVFWTLDPSGSPVIEPVRDADAAAWTVPAHLGFVNRFRRYLLWETRRRVGVSPFTTHPADAWTAWAWNRIRPVLPGVLSVRQIRIVYRLAMDLDMEALAEAARWHQALARYRTLRVHEYNCALRWKAECAQLRETFPHLVPVWLTLANAPGFPEEGNLLDRLHAVLTAHGISDRTWLAVLSAGERISGLLEAVRVGPREDPAERMIALLQRVDRMRLTRLPAAEWFATERALVDGGVLGG